MSFCITPQRFTQLYPKPDTPLEPLLLRNLTEIAQSIPSNLLTGCHIHVGMGLVRNLLIHVQILFALNVSGSISDSFSSSFVEDFRKYNFFFTACASHSRILLNYEVITIPQIRKKRNNSSERFAQII